MTWSELSFGERVGEVVHWIITAVLLFIVIGGGLMAVWSFITSSST